MATAGGEDDSCWICLEAEGELFQPCGCPRRVHATCLARWQLAQLGKREEKECRFCSKALPSWLNAFVPRHAKPPRGREATINVHGPDGSVHQVPLQPGLAGRRRFTRAVRELLGLPYHATFEFNFEVALPPHIGTAHRLSTADFEVVSHIASINAEFRGRLRQGMKHQREEEEPHHNLNHHHSHHAYYYNGGQQQQQLHWHPQQPQQLHAHGAPAAPLHCPGSGSGGTMQADGRPARKLRRMQ